MFLSLFKLILFGMFCLTRQVERNRPFTLEFYNTTCSVSGSSFKFYKCLMHRHPLGVYMFAVSFMLNEDFEDDFQVHLQLDLAQRYMRNPVRVIDIRLEACGSLRSASGNMLLKLLLKETRRTSNFPTHCPFKKDTLYGFDNFSLSPSVFPLYSPDTNFTIQVFFSHKKTLGVKHVSVGSILNKKRNLKL